MRSTLGFLLAALSLTLLAWLTGGRAGAQQPALVVTRIVPTEHLVTLYLAASLGVVPDGNALKLYEDGEQIEPTTVTTTTVGVAVAVLIDLSGSMATGGLPGSPSRLDDALAQTIQVARVMSPTTDLLTVVPFSGTVGLPPAIAHLDRPNSGDIDNWLTGEPIVEANRPAPRPTTRMPRSEAEYSQPYAQSDLSGAVILALEMLTDPQPRPEFDAKEIARLQPMHKVILIFGDSCDDIEPQIIKRADLDCTMSPEALSALAEARREHAVSVISIGVGDGTLARYDQLQALAEWTGGAFHRLAQQNGERPEQATARVEAAISNFLDARRTITVSAPPAPTSTPSPVPIPTSPPMQATPAPKSDSQPGDANLVELLLLVLAGLALALAGVSIWRRRRLKNSAPPINPAKGVFMLAVVKQGGLAIEVPGAHEKHYTLTNTKMTIGSDEEQVDIYLNGSNIAPRHATVSYNEPDFLVEQLEGTSDICINNRQLGVGQPTKLCVYDLLTIGDLTLQLFEQAGSEQAQAREGMDGASA